MAAPTNEKGLQKAIEKEVARRYPDVWVFHPVGSPYQATGVPDLLLCVKGQLVGMEVKFPRPGETRAHALSRATARQWSQIERIRKARGVADVVLSVEQAMDLIGEVIGVPDPQDLDGESDPETG